MNINFNDLERLIALAEHSDIDALEVVDGNQRISIINHAPAAAFLNHDLFNSGQASLAPSASYQPSAVTQNDNESSAETTKSSESAAATDTQQNQADAAATDTQIKAPMLGTFYRRSEPTADEFVQVGDTVEAGDTLCVVEAMKILHEVKATETCTIVEILAEEGEVVEYDQPLFVISTP